MAENKNKPSKEKPPVVLIELCDQRDSGFVLDGTAGTKFEQRITAPSAKFIPNTGFRLVQDEKTGEWYNEEIRFIKNQRELSVPKQKQLGINPSKNRLEDKIIIKAGQHAIVREGGYISLYDYIMQVFYNESNPDRPDSMTPIYRVVEKGKKEEKLNQAAFDKAEAIQWLSQFYKKQGKEYVYNTEKIDAVCQLFVVYADSPAGKINGLMAHIEADPKGFLDKAMKMEQTTVTEVSYALELGVVKFDKNVFAYANKEKIITDLGRGNLSQETKITKAADFLMAPENKSAYEDFKLELEIAQEKQLN